jgi:hypothetical protein
LWLLGTDQEFSFTMLPSGDHWKVFWIRLFGSDAGQLQARYAMRGNAIVICEHFRLVKHKDMLMFTTIARATNCSAVILQSTGGVHYYMPTQRRRAVPQLRWTLVKGVVNCDPHPSSLLRRILRKAKLYRGRSICNFFHPPQKQPSS